MFWGEHLRFLVVFWFVCLFLLFYFSDCFACKYFFAACVCSASWRTEEGAGNLELDAWLQNTMSHGCWEWNPGVSGRATSALICRAISPIPPLEYLGQKKLSSRY